MVEKVVPVPHGQIQEVVKQVPVPHGPIQEVVKQVPRVMMQEVLSQVPRVMVQEVEVWQMQSTNREVQLFFRMAPARECNAQVVKYSHACQKLFRAIQHGPCA